MRSKEVEKSWKPLVTDEFYFKDEFYVELYLPLFNRTAV